jgi:hypothetical protein
MQGCRADDDDDYDDDVVTLFKDMKYWNSHTSISLIIEENHKNQTSITENCQELGRLL